MKFLTTVHEVCSTTALGAATTINLTSPVGKHITGRMTDCMNRHKIFTG
jgi:hypothetical protein